MEDYTEDKQFALDDKEEDTYQEDKVVDAMIEYVMERYTKAEDSRRIDEERWLRAYRNYRGIYGPDVQFTETEKSRVFIKVTKTKVLAAYNQITDVLFSNNTFPISIEPSVLPEGVADSVHFDPKAPKEIKEPKVMPLMKSMESLYGFSGDGKRLPPGATIHSLKDRLGPLQESLSKIPDLKEGPGVTPSAITFFPAQVAAKRMEKKIMDQLDESNASKQLRSTAFEMALFGTGVMKGPFATDKEYPNWDEDGEYNPTIKTVPSTSHVSVWNFYPDPDANNMDEAEYIVERHKLSRSQMRALKKRPFFRTNVIDEVIDLGESYYKKYWEDDLSDYQVDKGVDRFEVLEFWGAVDKELLEQNEVEIPEDLQDIDQLQANIWVCNGKILRLVLNPFKPAKIPY